MSEDIKQVIVVRRDLKMPVGKLAAQVAHASMAFITDQIRHSDPESWISFSDIGATFELTLKSQEINWINNIFTKVVLGCTDLSELAYIHQQCNEAKIENHVITDAGLTVFTEPTVTCVGIGPDYAEKINKVTGHLKLY